jgi:biofilm PGA synthesis lipoprotein PgaB
LKKLLTVNHDTWDSTGIRMAQVDLDNIYDENPAKYQQNVNELLTQLANNNINAVALQAFADPDGDGNVDEVYFANSQIPVRADILGDVANRLQQQLITVLAWLPTLNYQTLIKANDDNAVISRGEKGWYHRISPFDQDALSHVNQLFYDLAANTQIDGILLQDDLYLNQDEDFSTPAQTAYQQKFGKDLSAINTADKAELAAFTQWKQEALDKAADGAIHAFKSLHPHAVIMRDIYAGALLYPDSENWLAQSYDDYLAKYDYTVVMAYPFMDKEDEPYEYLKKIAQVVKDKQGTGKTLVKIQTYDWDNHCWLDNKIFNRQMHTLKAAGMKNLGYYPLGFVHWEK